jgi:hypothetical protein
MCCSQQEEQQHGCGQAKKTGAHGRSNEHHIDRGVPLVSVSVCHITSAGLPGGLAIHLLRAGMLGRVWRRTLVRVRPIFSRTPCG